MPQDVAYVVTNILFLYRGDHLAVFVRGTFLERIEAACSALHPNAVDFIHQADAHRGCYDLKDQEIRFEPALVS